VHLRPCVVTVLFGEEGDKLVLLPFAFEEDDEGEPSSSFALAFGEDGKAECPFPHASAFAEESVADKPSAFHARLCLPAPSFHGEDERYADKPFALHASFGEGGEGKALFCCVLAFGE